MNARHFPGTQARRVEWQGQPAVELVSPDGAMAVVLMQGAQVVSWQRKDGEEQLYLSERAAYAAARPVRGGVPVIFPQFNERGPVQRHGFARNTVWAFEHASASRGGDALAVFSLRENPATLQAWPHTFLLQLTVRLSDTRLDLELAVTNTSLAPFEFTAALHTYVRVAEVEQAHLEGLQGLRYLDCVRGSEHVESSKVLFISGEVDSIYLDAGREIMLHDGRRRMRISMANFHDVVIWNPGAKKCAALDDMPPEGYRQMLCVEAAAIGIPIRLPAGREWVARQSLEYVDGGLSSG